MRLKTTIISTAAAVLLSSGIAVGVVYATHPRDEKAYLLEVGTHMGSAGKWAKDYRGNAPQFFIGQGNQACDWLGHQEIALWHTGRKYQLASLTSRYAAAAAPRDYMIWGGSREHVRDARRIVARAAFEHLCGATYEFRSQHLPIGDGPNK